MKVVKKFRLFNFLITAVLIGGTLSQPNTSAQANSSILFVENAGQFDETVHFQARGARSTLSLTDDGLWVSLLGQTSDNTPPDTIAIAEQGVHLKLGFANANPQPEMQPFNRLNAQISYFTGSDPTRWQADVPVWGGVRYHNLYPGIDLEVTGENGKLVQRLIQKQSVSSQSFSDIALQVEGAESLTFDDNGDLLITTAIGQISFPLLHVDGESVQIAGASTVPLIEGNTVYNPFSTTPPAPEPQANIAAASDLIYSTLLGGIGNIDTGLGIAIDESGHAFVTGQAYAGFPTTPGAFDPTLEGIYNDTFVAKINPDGTGLIYATYVGGTDFENATDIVIDEAGNAYIAGYTTSIDFPTSPGAFDATMDGDSDAFVVKLNADGTQLLYGSYLGGSENELTWGIDLDTENNAVITGFTPSTDFPTTSGAYDTTLDTWYDVFVTKFNADASSLIYSTFVGGENADYSFGGVAVDSTGNAYVSGYTHSANFPTTPDAFDTTYDDQEIFVFKLNPDGSNLLYSTFLGGSETEYVEGLTVDESGQVYLTGNTRSLDFPVTTGAFDPDYNSEPEEFEGDAFVAQLNAAGSDVVYATYLGGNGEDIGHAVVLDAAGNIYVTGETDSNNFPTTDNAFDATFNSDEEMFPPRDVFVSKLSPAGSDLSYSTYLGATEYDHGYGLVADDASNVYVTGATSSIEFPTTPGAFDTVVEGFKDIFISKLFTGSDSPGPDPTPTPTLPDYDCAPTPLGTIPVGETPRGIALDVAQQRVYVANYGSNSVSVIDTSTHTVLQEITGIPSANGLAYDGLHNMLWVSNYDTDQVTPIEVNNDATAFTVLDPVDVGDGPWGVVFDPIYGHLYVANSLGDSVSVINVAQRTVAATLTENFSQPFHLAATPVTGKVYVANFGNNTVTVIKGTTIESVVNLWDSAQPYGITVDETRNVVYVATVATNRIVALGTLNGAEDQFLGWSMFFRGYNRNRPLPLRVIAVNPEAGPAYDGGHLWTTTSMIDGSEQDQALLIPKGWSSYFHVPLPQNVGQNPSEGIAVDRTNDLVYVSSGTSPGTLTIIGDHDAQCPSVAPASSAETGFSLNIFSRQALMQGDVVRDGLIDIFDLTYVAGRYNISDYTADVNGDGIVDIFDLTMVANRYGQAVAEEN